MCALTLHTQTLSKALFFYTIPLSGSSLGCSPCSLSPDDGAAFEKGTHNAASLSPDDGGIAHDGAA